MATGWVRAEFFHTQTQPAVQDLWPGPDSFIKWIFFPRPKPALSSPASPTSLAQPGHFRAQSSAPNSGPIKKKILCFPKKKNHSSTNNKSK